MICRYIGAYTLHTCEKRAACWTAIAVSSGSISRLAFVGRLGADRRVDEEAVNRRVLCRSHRL